MDTGKTYYDINGKEIHMGDIVRISGCYFRSRNGVYFVEYEPGYANWSGSELALTGLNEKTGKLVSRSNPRHISFYPMEHFSNRWDEVREAEKWDKEYLRIENISGTLEKNKRLRYQTTVREFFEEKISDIEDFLEKRRIYCTDNDIERDEKALRQLRGIVERVGEN